MILGGFNSPNVDWNTWKTEGDSTDGEDYKIIKSLIERYWFQHVAEESKVRGINKSNLLHLILTNEEGMLSNLQHQSPHGESNHSCLVFNFNCRIEVTDKP